MRVIDWCRRFQPKPRNAWIAFVILLVGIALVQTISNSRLKAEVSRFQTSQTALLKERAYLQQISDLWKAEAVEWREKNGYVEPPITPPEPSDADYERPVAPEVP